MKIRLNQYARESAVIYILGVIEACRRAKVDDPRAALIDNDEYPALLKIPMAEYSIGWLHGCAEAHGVLVEVLWDQMLASKPLRAKKRAA